MQAQDQKYESAEDQGQLIFHGIHNSFIYDTLHLHCALVEISERNLKGLMLITLDTWFCRIYPNFLCLNRTL